MCQPLTGIGKNLQCETSCSQSQKLMPFRSDSLWLPELANTAEARVNQELLKRLCVHYVRNPPIFITVIVWLTNRWRDVQQVRIQLHRNLPSRIETTMRSWSVFDAIVTFNGAGGQLPEFFFVKPR